MPSTPAEIERFAQKAVPAAVAVLRQESAGGDEKAGPRRPPGPLLLLEATILSIAVIDANVMLGLDAGRGQQVPGALMEYLRDVWDFEEGVVKDLIARLAHASALVGEERGPSALVARDTADAIAQALVPALDLLVALTTPGAPEDAQRLRVAKARLERYRARAVVPAELDRVLNIAQRLLLGRKPPAGAPPRFRPGALEEGRRQAEAGLGRPIDEVRRDLSRPPPSAR